MIELDEKSLVVLGQMVREVGKTDKGEDDLMLGKFMENIYKKLSDETMRNLREEQNKGQNNAV